MCADEEQTLPPSARQGHAQSCSASLRYRPTRWQVAESCGDAGFLASRGWFPKPWEPGSFAQPAAQGDFSVAVRGYVLLRLHQDVSLSLSVRTSVLNQHPH